MVEIRATSQGDSDFGSVQQALGSGFVIDKAGHIVTNYHVVEGADELNVSFSGEEPVPATLVGSDPSTDLAVIKVDIPASGLTPLVLGDSDAVTVGDAVVAIGNPFGLDRTITAGIVSALQRNITAPNNFQIDHVIQTDAAINHGNSGGPLLDSRGEVIGVNAQIQGGSVDGNVGIGFAIPVNTVKAVASQLIESGKVEHPYMGVTLQEISEDLARNFRLPVDHGVLIGSVTEGTPAAAAGLEGGDTQVTLNGENYTLGGDIIVEGRRPGRHEGRRGARSDPREEAGRHDHPGDQPRRPDLDRLPRAWTPAGDYDRLDVQGPNWAPLPGAPASPGTTSSRAASLAHRKRQRPETRSACSGLRPPSSSSSATSSR